MVDEDTGTASETPELTLEQIASEFTVQQTEPAQTAPPVATESPKFDSPEDYQAWSANQLATVSQQLNSVTSELDQRKAQEFIETQDKAVNSAIEKIRADVEIPDSFIEGRLHVKYSRDENFRKIFDNRAQNPAAYDKALGIVANELKVDSQWQPDPQGAENARAIKDLQKNANRSPSPQDANQKYKEMSSADFDHEWERMKAGG
jgi:hypothetical protein